MIRPFECKIIGQAEGLARVKASIHTFFTTFDDEEWRIITLFVNHLDSQLKYTDLFAASCGSLGEFTDIKQSEEGYAMTRQMKHFNFPVRNLDGTFYAQVHPFDPSFFAVKVHPSGVLLFTPHHSQLTLLQHIILQAPFLKKPVQFLADTPKYWLEDDGTMCLHPSHRWKSDDTIAWLRKRGLHSVPTSIKAEIGDLVYNGPKQNNDSTASTSPPGRFVYFTGSRASNDPPPGLWNLMPMPVGQIGNSAPMSRRLNRESPCEARGLLYWTYFLFLTNLQMPIDLGLGHGPKWPHRLLW